MDFSCRCQFHWISWPTTATGCLACCCYFLILFRIFVSFEKSADKRVVMERLSVFHQRRRCRDLPVPDGRYCRNIIRLRKLLTAPPPATVIHHEHNSFHTVSTSTTRWTLPHLLYASNLLRIRFVLHVFNVKTFQDPPLSAIWRSTSRSISPRIAQ